MKEVGGGEKLCRLEVKSQRRSDNDTMDCVGRESSDECGYFVLAVTAAGVIERDPSCEREKEAEKPLEFVQEVRELSAWPGYNLEADGDIQRKW